MLGILFTTGVRVQQNLWVQSNPSIGQSVELVERLYSQDSYVLSLKIHGD